MARAPDTVGNKITWIEHGMVFGGDPRAKVPDEWMKELTEELRPKERSARQALAEAVAAELGHRMPEKPLSTSVRRSSEPIAPIDLDV
jgi:hypothetical protein